MVDYKEASVLSTTDEKITLMQWLQKLTKTFGNAVITDMSLSNDGDKSLTFTFTLADGSTKTATATAITMTEDEKALIGELVKTVIASSDGVTFNKAVTFAGNIVIKGNEIHNGYASFLDDESHAGAEMHKGEATFTYLKTNDVTATDGQGLLSYDGTNTALKGKADRPTYNGGVLALKSDIEDLQNAQLKKLYYYLGYYGWDGRTLYARNTENLTVSDPLVKNFTTYAYFFANGSFRNLENNGVSSKNLSFDDDFFNAAKCSYQRAFANFQCTGTLYLPNMNASECEAMFIGATFSKILIKDGCNVSLGGNLLSAFQCPNLTEIGAFDLSKAYLQYGDMFGSTSKVKTMHCTHWHFSFKISASTAFEEADLVEILNNLDTVSTTQTLTMGATNLAKLTSDEIKIATDKGWALA